MTSLASVALLAPTGLPMIGPGDDLAGLIASCLQHHAMAPRAGDVLVVAQKIVSKAEGRLVDLATVIPSPRALNLAARTGKDPRVLEVILSESVRVVRSRPGLVICEHRLGLVMANAGVDQSNIDCRDGVQLVLLLPRDPDASAEQLRRDLSQRFGVELAVIVSDSFGRAWRRGTVGVAIGVAGLPALVDLRRRPDLFARPLQTTLVGYADEIAAAASVLMGQSDEGRPVVLVRGLRWSATPSPAAELIRPAEEDLFR
jgi:coenzyme F420-0:L-glutamate ligase/coenzyme F420-1:gamma-L-glutamate ligase